MKKTKIMVMIGLLLILNLSTMNVLSQTITETNEKRDNQNYINFRLIDVQYPETIYVDEDVFFDAEIALEGEIPAAISVEVYFYIDGIKNAEDTIEFSPYGEKTKTASVMTRFFDTRRHRVKFEIDPNEEFEEIFTDDNTWTNTVKAPRTIHWNDFSNIRLIQVIRALFF